MKKGQIVKGHVTIMDFPNKGFVEVRPEDNEGISEPEMLRVNNAVLGQIVECSVKKARKNKAEGRLLSVLAPSLLESKEDYCPHFGECGGCLYQKIPYDNQRELKEEQLRRLLAPVIGDDFVNLFEGVISSPREEYYRNKMEFSFGDAYQNGPLALGMHKRGSFYDIVNVEGCRICEKDMSEVLRITLSYFEKKNISYYHRLRHNGYLRHLLVRQAAATDEILIDLVTSGEEPTLLGVDINGNQGEDADLSLGLMKADISEEDLLEGWKNALLEGNYKGEITGILHTRNTREADVVEDHGTKVLYGKDSFDEILLGLKFHITPFSFFQTNSLGAEVLYMKVRDYIQSTFSGGACVYDLYSGTGTIAQIMADAADKVIGVEIVEEAVEAAKENAKENGLNNCEFIAGDVLKVLDDIEEKPDFIILDPPRDGVNPKALKKILNYGVNSMIYISCKPTSLARDLPAFFEAGYEVKKISAVDMFPSTANCEVVCLLKKE
ncbi:MAG: class I SAM-dependent RNA methyltransferase [Lachnospiraceae bacterium]|nr:class I SAM-dependent RNA methyltransferase [Lachnospiraceae bacterium]